MPRLRLLRLPLLCLVAVVLFVTACGGGGSSSGNPQETPAANSTPVTDEEYMKAFCVGLDRFYDLALSSRSTLDEMKTAIKDYVATLEGITPPADIKDFHTRYTKYLKDFSDDPPSLLASPPPLPPDGPRSRLNDAASRLSECRYPTFLASASSP